ncbi:MAG: S8 family serine peptidase [Solirubrobacterales bacterium]
MGRRTHALLVAIVALLVAATAATAAAPDTPRRDGDVIAGQWIVTYDDSVGDSDAATDRRAKARGFKATHRYRNAIKGFSAKLSSNQVQALRADSEVAAVTPDRRVRALATVAPGETAPTGVRRMQAVQGDEAQDAATDAVAVIDTGVDLSHPDLDAESGTDCVAPGTSAQDEEGHGTHVAGTIAAGNSGSGVVGVAPGTKVIAVRVLDASGAGSTASVVCGIDWVTANAAAKKITVANMSLGGGGPRVQSCGSTTDPEHQAICKSTGAGVTYAVAAGNSGWDFDYASNPDVPAAYPEVVTVSAVSDTDGQPGGLGPQVGKGRNADYDDRYASFSNYAATSEGAAHTVAAPGLRILSDRLGGGTATLSGTSMAAPHIAGHIALCKTAGGCTGNTPGSVISELTATSLGDTSYGFQGDPGNPVGGRYYGWLARVGAAPTGGGGDPVDGGSGAGDPPAVDDGGSLEVTAGASSVNKKWQFVTVTWSPSDGAGTVTIKRDGMTIASVSDSGSYTDKLAGNDESPHTYRVCEGSVCGSATYGP